MKLNPHKLRSRIKSKGSKSLCNYRVVAIALDKKGKFIGIKSNRPRNGLNNNYRNSYHAEELLIHSMKAEIIDTILIGRIEKSGNFLPIDPCKDCQELADRYNIKIRRI